MQNSISIKETTGAKLLKLAVPIQVKYTKPVPKIGVNAILSRLEFLCSIVVVHSCESFAPSISTTLNTEVIEIRMARMCCARNDAVLPTKNRKNVKSKLSTSNDL
jgi:hypothetical protein